MDMLEAIKSRKSVRAFKPDPVRRDILEELLDTCLRAPSWGNSQPWEFTVVGGEVLAELKRRLVEQSTKEVSPNPDIPWPSFGPPWDERRRQNGRRIFDLLGIARDDAQKRQDWSLGMVNFFGAPSGIIFYLDRSLGTWSILDVGSLLMSITLAAQAYGLGTCPEAAVARYPDILREVLKIPDTKYIVCGLAIGYPDPDAPVNRFRSEREPLDAFATWHGL